MEIDYFVCPVCRMHKRIEKKLKGRIKFEFDLETEPIIVIREGGKGYRDPFKIIKKLTLKEAQKDEKYSKIINEFKQHIENLHKILEKV